MNQYQELLRKIKEKGTKTKDRTGVGTISLFGEQIRFDLSDGFPAITTKRLAWKSVVAELMWFLEGSTDERRLAELTYGRPRSELKDKTTIWTANADSQGRDLGYPNNEINKELGPIYGAQWRAFSGNSEQGWDQIKWLISEIKSNPESRRLILSAWNPNFLIFMALPPCHFACQFSVKNGKLSCMLSQRSADVFLGSPFNIASYALLTHILAKECSLDVGDLVYSIGDAHIYSNHIDQVDELLSRKPKKLPTLHIDKNFVLSDKLDEKFEINITDKFKLIDYSHWPTIKADMAV